MSTFGPAKARLQALQKAASKIFRQSYNPSQDRRGSGVLRAQLKGETLQNYYYPNNFLTFKYVKEQFPDQYMFDHMEDYRLFIIRDRRRRGKGAPPKKTGPAVDDKKKKKKK